MRDQLCIKKDAVKVPDEARSMKTATLHLLALLQTGASFDASQRRHPTKKTMALQVTRVEQAMGNGLRRLYRLPKLTMAPSKATRSVGSEAVTGSYQAQSTRYQKKSNPGRTQPLIPAQVRLTLLSNSLIPQIREILDFSARSADASLEHISPLISEESVL